MARTTEQHLSVAAVKPYLPTLRDRFSSVTLSGGEPLLAPELVPLILQLSAHAFSITLLTNGDLLTPGHPSLSHLAALHLSVHSDSGLDSARQLALAVHNQHPRLRLSLNILVNPDATTCFPLSNYLDIATTCKASLKFLSPFSQQVVDSPNSRSWDARWLPLAEELATHSFATFAATPRDVSYMNSAGQIVQLADVGCISTDRQYANGRCFDTMDVTVRPDLTVQLCRWQNNNLPLADFLCSDLPFGARLTKLARSDAATCPVGAQLPPIAAASTELDRYVFDDHKGWPDVTQAAAGVTMLLRRQEVSYLGTAGVVAALEREFADYHGSPYCVSTPSGTTALYLAYWALGFRQGTEVIVPSYSYPAVLTALLHLGATVRFCDIDPFTGNLDPDSLLSAITPATKGVVVTHMWGLPAPMDPIVRICRARGLSLVEDCSHATGAEYDGRKVGTFGDIACFSFQANKTICAGEGGALITTSPTLFEAMIAGSSMRDRILDSVRASPLTQYWRTGLGLKLKIHPLGAALALSHLRRLDSINNAGRRLAEYMAERLADLSHLLSSPPTNPRIRRVYYTYKGLLSPALLQRKAEIVASLISDGLRIAQSDLFPLHRLPLPAQDGQVTSPVSLAGTNAFFDRAISLPLLFQAPAALLDYYLSCTRTALAQYSIPQPSTTQPPGAEL